MALVDDEALTRSVARADYSTMRKRGGTTWSRTGERPGFRHDDDGGRGKQPEVERLACALGARAGDVEVLEARAKRAVCAPARRQQYIGWRRRYYLATHFGTSVVPIVAAAAILQHHCCGAQAPPCSGCACGAEAPSSIWLAHTCCNAAGL